MEKKPQQIHSDQWLKDLPIQSQNEGFKPEEMISCPKCERRNPPNRLKCFYCGAELPLTETKFIKPNLRKLENWEKGFNVIFQPDDSDVSKIEISETAKLLSIENEDLRKIFNLKKPLPIARVESEREAKVVQERLNEFGLKTNILSDENLKMEIQPQRLRGIEFYDDKLILILFNADKIEQIERNDLRLIVSGLLFERKIESTEKYNRKKENKILEATEISLDEPLIDIYSRSDSTGYRILAKGFDFSCLGADKKLLVNENMKTLAEKLKVFAPEAKFDDDYRHIRVEIGHVWEVEQRKNSKGVKKKSFSSINLENVTTVDNLSQFTKYSRLQWHLL